MNTHILLDILSYPRFAGSAGEQHVLSEYFTPIEGSYYDQFGNWWYCTDLNSTTLFTAHSDTVHKRGAVDKIPLSISSDNIITVEGGGVLGADCGTGMFIILEMIRANVPGTYVIYREEEIGGNGSSSSAYEEPHLYEKFNRAISFDRAGYTDVITAQAGGVCCSDDFAQALADQLGMGFAPSHNGVFTDSANLTDLVPECTNLSVGYLNQHSKFEMQDLGWLEKFIKAVKQVDWESLPVVRSVSKSVYLDYLGFEEPSQIRLLDIVERNPVAIAALLEEMGFDTFELEKAIDDLYR